MRSLLPLALVAGLPALPAQWQFLVHPPEYRAVEGEAAAAIPLGHLAAATTPRQFRYQQVHDPITPLPITIASFALRRDGGSRFDWRGFTVELELTLATSPVPAAQASATFAANLGLDAKVLVSRSILWFPPSFPGPDLPAPFEFYLPCG